MRQNTFGDTAQRELERVRQLSADFIFGGTAATRQAACRTGATNAFPTCHRIPRRATSDAPKSSTSRCRVSRRGLRSTGLERVVIGVSGGIDSTHALLVCARAMDRLGTPRKNILAVTMPGFATSERTLEQARRLMKSLGCRPTK